MTSQQVGVFVETLLTGSIGRGQVVWFNSDTWHKPCATRLAWHGFPLERSSGHANDVELQVVLKTFCQPDSASPALWGHSPWELSR